MDLLNDGSVVANSRDVTINGVIYTATDWKWDGGSTKIVRRDKNSKPSGRKLIVDENTGSATLQLATTSTVLPPERVPFTTTEGTFYLDKVGRSETNNGETTVPVTFCKAITGSLVQSN